MLGSPLWHQAALFFSPTKEGQSGGREGNAWNAKGIVFIDYLQKGHTINGEYYANLQRQLQKAIKSKQPGELTKGVLFHQNKAPPHKSVVALAAVYDCGSELVDHATKILPCLVRPFLNTDPQNPERNSCGRVQSLAAPLQFYWPTTKSLSVTHLSWYTVTNNQQLNN